MLTLRVCLCCVCSAGLLMGGPRLLLSQQVVFGHRAPLGRQIQERDHPPLFAQPRPEEGDLELHPLCVRNTVSNCFFFPSYRHLTFLCVQWINLFVCGSRYDDYDYGEVNQLLERDLKLYIKAVACFPDATKTPVCPLSWAPLKTSERVRKLLTFRCVTSWPSLCSLFDCFISSPPLRYTWTYSSWRPGCRLSCYTLWEPSLSTWLPKCSERHKAKTFRRYRETERDEDEEIWTAVTVKWDESGTLKDTEFRRFVAVPHECSFFLSDLMYLYHCVPQNPSHTSSPSSCCEVLLSNISALKGYVQLLLDLF